MPGIFFGAKFSTFAIQQTDSELKRLAYIVPIVLAIGLLLPRCAKIVAPTGGPKDTLAPVLIRSNPEPNAINFKGQKISMHFNEYIQLKDLQKKLVLSPPQKQLPEIRLKGKGFDVVFAEELIPNVTYTLYFDDAIGDNNEGNKISNFVFAFSTGPYIDSLVVTGKIVDSYTLDPVEGMLVMLYDRFTDSLPLRDKPLYVSKTNKQGYFSLNNLKASDYKIFALSDANSNYLFDQLSEAIAFSADTVKPFFDLKTKTDTLPVPAKNPLILRSFKEANRVLRFTDYSRKSRQKISLAFSGPHPEPVNLSPILNKTIEGPWYVPERNVTGDSVTFWLTDPELFNADTLDFFAEFIITDSLFNRIPASDTLRFIYAPREQPDSRRGRRRGEETAPKKAVLGYILSPDRATSLSPRQSISFTFSAPLEGTDFSRINLFNTSDSVHVSQYKWERDAVNPRKYELIYPWEHKKSYSFLALPGAFRGIDGLASDSIKFTLAGVAPEMFGSISLKIKGVSDPVIVELINERGKTIDWQLAHTDCTLNFQYITPETYSFRFVVDSNRNGKWDTGSYLRGLQPEKVYYLLEGSARKKLNIRRNWEYELNINMTDFK